MNKRFLLSLTLLGFMAHDPLMASAPQAKPRSKAARVWAKHRTWAIPVATVLGLLAVGGGAYALHRRQKNGHTSTAAGSLTSSPGGSMVQVDSPAPVHQSAAMVSAPGRVEDRLAGASDLAALSHQGVCVIVHKNCIRNLFSSASMRRFADAFKSRDLSAMGASQPYLVYGEFFPQQKYRILVVWQKNGDSKFEGGFYMDFGSDEIVYFDAQAGPLWDAANAELIMVVPLKKFGSEFLPYLGADYRSEMFYRGSFLATSFWGDLSTAARSAISKFKPVLVRGCAEAAFLQKPTEVVIDESGNVLPNAGAFVFVNEKGEELWWNQSRQTFIENGKDAQSYYPILLYEIPFWPE